MSRVFQQLLLLTDASSHIMFMPHITHLYKVYEEFLMIQIELREAVLQKSCDLTLSYHSSRLAVLWLSVHERGPTRDILPTEATPRRVQLIDGVGKEGCSNVAPVICTKFWKVKHADFWAVISPGHPHRTYSSIIRFFRWYQRLWRKSNKSVCHLCTALKGNF